MDICLLEPFHAGSHAAWAEDYARHSRHRVTLLSLPGRHWKWRMHGGAVSLAEQFARQRLAPDLILASDMLDLATFLSLTRRSTAHTATALYFHENQLTYPWSPQDADPQRQRDAHYAFINYSSALAADGVLFNSAYHRHAFLAALPAFLKSFPDQRLTATVAAIAAKSRTLPLGLDLRRLETARPAAPPPAARVPLILWNHRWEYDKNPQEFFDLLGRLAAEGLAFEVAVLGEAYRQRPAVFATARQQLGRRLVQFGYADRFDDYAAWLWRADLLPVHSLHDFFGASVVQAIYCGVQPLLPERLAYPEHIPAALHKHCFYRDRDDLLQRLRRRLRGEVMPVQQQEVLRAHVGRYDWSVMAPRYDEVLEGIAGRRLQNHISAGVLDP